VTRALRRIARATGAPLDETAGVLERRTAEGVRIISVWPASSSRTHAIVLRKPQRLEAPTLDELVRSGMISRAVATLLGHLSTSRANVLVTGPAGSGYGALISALAHGYAAEERVIALQDDDELTLANPNVLALPLNGGAADAPALARAVTRMRPDRLILGSLAGLAAEIISAHGEGVGSIVAAARAPTLRHALARLTADIALSRPGTSVEAARESLAATFDIALEVARLRDGRARLVRVAELKIEGGALAPRDIFTFTVERTAAGGAIEGSLHPTGSVPALVEDLSLRGGAIDAGIFRRAVTK
jgi:pilus assembly protein CpaF